MAQLPPRVPLGLQDGRTGQLPAELYDRFHRFLLQDRLGVRSEDGFERDHRAASQANGRRFTPDMGLGRQGSGQDGDRARQDHQP